MTEIEVVEFTDPVCSYAWGTEPKMRRLQWQYGDRLRLRRVVAGLMADGWEVNAGLALDDPALPPAVCEYWRDVHNLTGMPYPTTLSHIWTSSEAACRLVKAAELQGADPADRFLRRLRESWFVFGRPADTVERAVATAAGIDGLDSDRLGRDAASAAVAAAYLADWEETRQPNEHVLSLEDDRVGFGKAQLHNGRLRFGLPCLVLTGPAGEATIPGWRDWSVWEDALEAVAPGVTATARPLPTPAEAFAAWPLLAPPELALLCGADARPPAGVVMHDWGAGVVWLTPDEAERRLPSGVPAT